MILRNIKSISIETLEEEIVKKYETKKYKKKEKIEEEENEGRNYLLQTQTASFLRKKMHSVDRFLRVSKRESKSARGVPNAPAEELPLPKAAVEVLEAPN